MPTLTPTSIATPRAAIGTRKVSMSREHSHSTASRCSTSAMTTVNSSPPIRTDQRRAVQLRRESPRDLAQHIVADVVTQRVVDLFETVQVEHQQGGTLTVLRLGEQRPEVAHERHTVRQPGQRVVGRLMLERAALRLPLGDVADHGDEESFLGRDLAQRDLDRQLATVRRTRRALHDRSREWGDTADVAEARNEFRSGTPRRASLGRRERRRSSRN